MTNIRLELPEKNFIIVPDASADFMDVIANCMSRGQSLTITDAKGKKTVINTNLVSVAYEVDDSHVAQSR